MSQLQWKTKNKELPQGKPRVYFTCHPKDFSLYFESLSEEILNYHNCVVYYYEAEDSVSADARKEDLSEMQLVVVPVTEKFLSEPSAAFDLDFSYAIDRHIPVLPILMEEDLTGEFNEKCGNLQVLDKYESDETTIGFSKKLKQFLDSVLADDALAEKVRAAFDAYVFLSYRKTDRKYAKELMKLIHKNEFCRDIAIWYDEFLVPGENFHTAIGQAIEKSKLFTMVVTPNLLEHDNYIMTTEYPLAKEKKLPILAAEALPTDKARLHECFRDLPECTDIHNETALSDSLLNSLKELAVRTNDSSPEHLFFIGLAYLNGIDVETNYKQAVSLITSAAKSGLKEAIRKLSSMYRVGEGVKFNYETAIYWQAKLLGVLEKQPDLATSEEKQEEYFREYQSLYRLYIKLSDYENVVRICAKLLREINRLTTYDSDSLLVLEVTNRLAIAYQKIRQHHKAKTIYEKLLPEVIPLTQKAPEQYEDIYATLCNNLGFLYSEIKEYAAAKPLYEAAISIRERLAQENPARYQSNLAANYNGYGWLLSELGEYEAAEEVYKKARTIREAQYEKSPTRANANRLITQYRYFGTLYKTLKKDAEAQEYLEKALRLAESIAEQNPVLYLPTLASCHFQLGVFYDNRNQDYNSAEFHLKKAADIYETLFENNKAAYLPDLAKSYRMLSGLYQTTASYAEAKNYLEKAVTIYKALVKERPEIYEQKLAHTYIIAGSLHQSHQELHKAEKSYQKALAIREKLWKKNPGAEAAEYSSALLYLGNLYQKMHHYRTAREFYQKALELRETLYRASHDVHRRELAGICVSFGALMLELKKYSDAETHYRKALALFEEENEKNPGSADDNLARACNQLGILFRRTGRYEEAEKYYLSAISLKEKAAEQYPKMHLPALASHYDNLGVVYENTSRYSDALSYQTKALELRKRLSEENPAVYERALAMSYNNLSVLHSSMGNYQEEKDCVLRAIAIRERLAEENPDVVFPDLAQSYLNAGKAYENLKEYTLAEEYYKKAIELRQALSREAPSAHEPELALGYSLLGGLYKKTDRFEQSEEAYQKGISLRKKLAEHDSGNLPALGTGYHNAGVMYEKFGKYRDAEAMYQKAIETREKLAKNKQRITYLPSLISTHTELASLYKSGKRTSQAAREYQILVDLYSELWKNNPQKYVNEYIDSLVIYAEYYETVKKYRKAATIYQKSVELVKILAGEDSQLKNRLATIHNNYGFLLETMRKSKEAEKEYRNAIRLREEIRYSHNRKYSIGLAINYRNLGLLYKKKKNFGHAKWALKESYKVYQELGRKYPGEYREQLQQIEKDLEF